MRKLYIMQGLPGSGKTSYIKNFVKDFPKDHFAICSADDFFMKDGEYKFNPSGLSMAHAECFKKFLKAAVNETPYVFVDNTNTEAWQIAPYYLAGQSFGYDVTIIQIKARIEECMKRNLIFMGFRLTRSE